jgi:hypothetical protein
MWLLARQSAPSKEVQIARADDIELLEPDGASFRSLTKMTAKQRDAALAAGSLALILSDWVDHEFELPATDIPDFGGATPDVAAQSLRQHWGLGELPIKNMVHLLEAIPFLSVCLHRIPSVFCGALSSIQGVGIRRTE